MKNILYTFAKNLSLIRKTKGFSQNALGKSSNVSQKIISLYENEQLVPQLDKIERIAKALDVSISDLLDDTTTKHIDKKLFNEVDHILLKKFVLIKSLTKDDQKNVFDYINTLAKKSFLEKKLKT